MDDRVIGAGVLGGSLLGLRARAAEKITNRALGMMPTMTLIILNIT